jgi:hypothetical protein
MNEEFQKFLDSKHSAFECIAVKGMNRGDYTQIQIKPKGVDIVIAEFWLNVNDKPNKDKKHTGGKKSYSKIYNEWLLNNKDIGIELLGAMVKLSPYIEWHTGRLVELRKKDSIKMDRLFKLWKVSKPTGLKLIKKLKELNLFTYRESSYFIATDFIGKGGGKIENNNL